VTWYNAFSRRPTLKLTVIVRGTSLCIMSDSIDVFFRMDYWVSGSHIWMATGIAKICTLKANIDEVISQLSWSDKLQGLKARFMNMQSKRRSYTVAHKHYNVGNDLYQKMLDRRMVYSCGYWRKGAKNLDEAQEAKLDLICRKVGLKEGDTVLDIGSGFGSFLIYAAETYGASGTGVTVSEEQAQLARDLSSGLSVEILLQDYREPIVNRNGTLRTFDYVVSVGMFEHVGPKNYRTFMEVASNRIKLGGLLLLQTIGQPTSRVTNDRWTHKYIFPNSQAPSLAQLSKAAEGIFSIEDVHTFGLDYERTLMAWHKNFNDNWNALENIRNVGPKYDKRFRRMWNYYLLCAAGMARSQRASLWQIVLSRADIVNGYCSIR
jgi:cyclopropane-fatty-acyl-phospholipid synthase